jgi:hypothetical protein
LHCLQDVKYIAYGYATAVGICLIKRAFLG